MSNLKITHIVVVGSVNGGEPEEWPMPIEEFVHLFRTTTFGNLVAKSPAPQFEVRDTGKTFTGDPIE